ncbi:RHS repeat-associated core domain-containing protein [Anaerovorax odorimutans]|uniref:RHS repeat-associated core domain-containing protein n=1 Tax=Anaerovorax odorimutans TaxID=109327 RepID=UPI000423EDF1|nr:RHS repeat-associated core domain-containing protein [Anaerovorax odorimutans]
MGQNKKDTRTKEQPDNKNSKGTIKTGTAEEDKINTNIEKQSNISSENNSLPDFVAEKIFNKLDTSSLSTELARKLYYTMIDYQGTKDELLVESIGILKILTLSSSIYSQLTEDNKLKLCKFFGISENFFNYSEEKGENLEKAILIYSNMLGYGLTDEKIEKSIQEDTRDALISTKKQEQLSHLNSTQKNLIRLSSTDEDPFSDVKYDKEKTLEAPFNHNNTANEQIDLGSGTLKYIVTDVILPGAGGLDLVIQRQYSTEQANYYDISGKLAYGTSSRGKPIYSYMNVYEREKYFEKNADDTMGEQIDATSYDAIGEDYMESRAFKGLYNMKQIEDKGDYYSAHLYKNTMSTSLTSNMFAKQISNPITRNEELWQLGAGWKFNFSYIDTDLFYYDFIKLHLSDGREFGVSSNWVNNLGYYLYKDVIFATESNTIAGQSSSYTVTYADGKKEYFNSAGRLIAIVDRFGNTISFTYTTVNNMLEMQITDTLGRIITLKNEVTASGYNKVLRLPDGKTITYILNHNTARTLNAFDKYESFAGQHNEYNLMKAINQEGEATSYTYSDIKCASDFAARFHLTSSNKFLSVEPFDDEDTYYPNYYAGLTKIIYPTGLMVNYEYYQRRNNWYDYGSMEDIALKRRYDQQGTTLYNEKEYDYSYRYKKNGVLTNFLYNADGYHNELSESNPFDDWMNWWVKETDLNRNITTKYTFDYRRGNCVEEDIYVGSGLTQKNTIDYHTFNLFVHPSKSKVTTNRYNTSNVQTLTTIDCYDYDNKGNVISYWPALSEGNTSDTEYKVTMTYNNQYNYLTGKTYKRDVASTINEKYVPTADQKSIAQFLTYENGNLKAKSELSYDTYGNVIKNKQYTDLQAGIYTETDHTYMNGTYLSNIAVQNVKNADGINLGGILRQATYDIYGRILTETDGKGNVTTYTYDDLGRVIKIMYPNNSTKTYNYNTVSNETTITDERGYATRYKYDPAGNLTAVYSIDGGNATLLKANEYDRVYRLIKYQNNLSEGGGATTYSYDYLDRILKKSSVNASNQILSQENNSYYDDKVIKTILGDANSKTIVTTEYMDKYGRLIKQGRSNNGKEVFSTFVYNYLGEVIKENSARANEESYPEDFTTKYKYAHDGKVIKKYDVLGNFITTGYDAAGRKISQTDAKSNASGGSYRTLYTYDTLGRLIKEETPFTAGAASVTKYYYDKNGNLIQKQIENSLPGADAAFTKIEYTYNNQNKLVQVKSYDGSNVANEVNYEYDTAGNMTTMVTGNGTQRTTYEYDRFGYLKTLTDPLGQKETYSYDINGNMISKTDKNGLTTAYTYDGLSRNLSQSITKEGTKQQEIKAYTLTGAIAYVQNENLKTSYTYDEQGKVITEVDSNGIEKNYTYDANGNVKTSVVKVNDAVVKTMSYVYDKKDRLSEVYEAGNLVATYIYDANGNRRRFIYGNGNSVDYAYNLANLVTSLENKKGTETISSYDYTYYLNGNQAAKVDNNGLQTSYIYDGLGRLTKESESGTADAITKTYTFDAAGNRATITVTGAENYTTGYQYDLNNRLTTETKQLSDKTEVMDYYYDNNGNTIAKNTGTLSAISGAETLTISLDMTGAELYSYDGFDRMTGVQNSKGRSSYTYRPDGLRLSKTVNGEKTTQVWEGQDITLELNENDEVINRYIRGIGLINSDNNGWYLFNGHGNVVQLTDSTGNVTKEYVYDAFGNEKNIYTNDTNPFRYSGEYFDAETGTVYLRARYYDPVIGRFITEDSYTGNSEDPLSLNLYTYCKNNPILYTDPSGHSIADAKWSQNQYNYYKDLASKGNKWAQKQIDENNVYVDNDGHVYTNKQVWEYKHPNFIDGIYIKATKFHFENRDKLNGVPPTYEEVTKRNSGWILLSQDMSVYHDNGKGKPELKFINPNGREAVFDGDTLKPITDSKYKATYNYVTPAPKPSKATDIKGWAKFAGKGAGHFVTDMLPYYLTNNKNDRIQ